jgi:hypothetical protein
VCTTKRCIAILTISQASGKTGVTAEYESECSLFRWAGSRSWSALMFTWWMQNHVFWLTEHDNSGRWNEDVLLKETTNILTPGWLKGLLLTHLPVKYFNRYIHSVQSLKTLSAFCPDHIQTCCLSQSYSSIILLLTPNLAMQTDYCSVNGKI